MYKFTIYDLGFIAVILALAYFAYSKREHLTQSTKYNRNSRVSWAGNCKTNEDKIYPFCLEKCKSGYDALFQTCYPKLTPEQQKQETQRIKPATIDLR
jgi:hypothetical protein